MKLNKNKSNGIHPLLALGGIALVSHLLNNDDKQTVQIYENAYDDRELKQQERILEKKQAVLDKQRKIDKEKSPNKMEYIVERVNGEFSTETILCAMGIYITFSIALMAGAEISKTPINIFVCLGCIIGGVLLVKRCLKINALKKKYLEYISIIVIQGERNIVNIANHMKTSYDEAYKNILFMLSKSFIKGYYIDKNSRMIISSNYNNQTNIYNNHAFDTKNTSGGQNKCSACGSNVFIEMHGEKYCKYCGTKV